MISCAERAMIAIGAIRWQRAAKHGALLALSRSVHAAACQARTGHKRAAPKQARVLFGGPATKRPAQTAVSIGDDRKPAPIAPGRAGRWARLSRPEPCDDADLGRVAGLLAAASHGPGKCPRHQHPQGAKDHRQAGAVAAPGGRPRRRLAEIHRRHDAADNSRPKWPR